MTARPHIILKTLKRESNNQLCLALLVKYQLNTLAGSDVEWYNVVNCVTVIMTIYGNVDSIQVNTVHIISTHRTTLPINIHTLLEALLNFMDITFLSSIT